MINEDLTKIKKGSFEFLKREKADLERVKESYFKMLER
jgi:hypothetical protein